MILTCPACSTNYVVKDGAIPPHGRQVRCAACKHSWHQDGDGQAPAEIEAAPVAEPVSAAEEHSIEATLDRAPWDHSGEAVMTSSPDDGASVAAETTPWDDPSAAPLPESFDATAPVATAEDAAPFARPASDTPLHSFAEPVAFEPEPVAEVVEAGPAPEPSPPAPAEDDFERYSPIYDEDEPTRRRWPWVLVLLALIVAAAAAFWFLAPPSWKVRAGIAGAAGSALEVKVDSTDRTPLAQSDKDLVTVSGRIINNSDLDQSLPPIHVLLSDKASKKVVHRWTIAPPVATLAPRQATNFNSAEIGVPRTGEDLTVRLGP